MPITIVKKKTIADYRAMGLQGQLDLFYMLKYILGYEDYREEVHTIMTNELMALTPNESRLMLWPRNTYKSTTCVIGYPLWLISRTAWLLDGTPPDPSYGVAHPKYGDTRINITGYTQVKASEYLTEIKTHMEEDTLFRYLYRGSELQALDDVPDKYYWNSQMIEVSTRRLRRKEPTISVQGITGVKTGKHYDTGIVDDPVDPMHVKKPEERARVLNGFRAIAPQVVPGGNKIVIGTRWHMDDLYAWIIKKTKVINFTISIRPAIHPRTGELMFPTIFSRTYLRLQLEILGSELYALNYLLDPTKVGDTPFQKIYWARPSKLPRDQYVIALINDFNDSTKKDANWTVSAIVAYGMKRHIVFLCDIWMAKKIAEDSAADCIQMANAASNHWPGVIRSEGMKTGFRGIYIEGYVGQKLMRIPLRHEMVKQHLIAPLHILPTITKKTKDFRIRSLKPRFEGKGIVFNADKRHDPSFIEAVEQLVRYPLHAYDDFPDALAQVNQIFTHVTHRDEVVAIDINLESMLDLETLRAEATKNLMINDLSAVFTEEVDDAPTGAQELEHEGIMDAFYDEEW